MKTHLLILIFILSIHHLTPAQNDHLLLNRIYKARISLTGEQQKMKGGLFKINDSSIMVSNSLRRRDYYYGKFRVEKVDVPRIDIIEINVDRNIWEGIGGLGLVAGVVTGLFYDSGRYFLDFTTLGLVLGGGLGIFIDLTFPIKIKIPINGSQEQFDLNKNKLGSYSIKYKTFREVEGTKQ